MTSTGIRRKVDDLGRIVIPAGIRRSLGIRDGDPLEVAVEGDRIVLAKPADRCVFCGSDQSPLEHFHGKVICRSCIASVGVLDGQVRRVPSGRATATHVHDDPALVHHLPPAPDVASAVGSRTAAGGPDVDERVAGTRDERRASYDPASTTAW